MTGPITRACRAGVLLALLSTAACLPYTVGSTAQTVPLGDVVRTSNASFVIGGRGRFADTASSGTADFPNLLTSDQEIRYGLSDYSDVGLRVTSASGLVFNYKRRHAGDAHPDSAGFATMWGVGIVNWAEHAFLESTALWSGNRRGQVTPYGGLRVMHVLPISTGALRDSPSAGLFLGLRLGSMELGVTPEIAVYYDEPVLGTRVGNIVVVPSVTLQGISLLPRIFR